MSFAAIVDWTVQNRVAKYQSYPTEAEATAHADKVRARFPRVFVAEDPGGGVGEWLIDPVAKTLSVDIIPPTPPPTNKAMFIKRPSAVPGSDIGRPKHKLPKQGGR